MKPTMGIILNNPSIDLGALTEIRSVITLPFASRYRLIDFALSNMVNSKIDKIGVFASNKYRSLIDHIGTGQEWSMARKSQDLIILQGGVPNYMGNRTTRINLADFYDNFGLFSRNTYSDLVISASNMVCNIDLAPVMRQHTETDADVTLVTKRIVSALDQSGDDVGIQGGEGNRVVGLSDNNNQGFDRVYLDMMIIRGSLLTRAIRDSLTTRSYDLIDVIARYIGELKVYFFDYPGYFRKINSIQSYYTASMDMLNPVITSRLFNPERWISTKVKDNPPTRYTKNAQVVNSLVASGCTVEGYLNSSVIFRHNSIGTGTTVNGSIIMEDCSIGRNVILENVILDRMVTISDDVVLQGTPENPVVLGKGVKI